MKDTRTLIRAGGMVETDLPDGICGRIEAIALTYGVVDSYNTRFRKGCLERSRQKVNAGKVGLYLDHTYDTDHHAGVLRSMEMRGNTEVIGADLFDTEPGRRAKEWIQSVLAAGAEPGTSVGFFDTTREMDWGFKVRTYETVRDAEHGDVLEFTEIELEELSLTPRPAVPGARVTGVRSDVRERHRLALTGSLAILGAPAFRGLVDEVLAGRTEVEDTDRTAEESPTETRADTSRTDTEDTPRYATAAERLMAVRQSYRGVSHHGGAGEGSGGERAEGTGQRAA
jgi:hypothetical protein